MKPNPEIAALFEEIRDPNEEILYAGKPLFLPFLFPSFWLLAAVLIYAIVIGSLYLDHYHHQPRLIWEYLSGSLWIQLVPIGLGLGWTVWKWLSYPNTRYAFSDKRVMIRSGVWGIDYKTINYDKIRNISVKVNPLENRLGAGTVLFFSGEIDTGCMEETGSKKDKFIGIIKPYETFRQIKTLKVDIQADWNYPNALRPDINPGVPPECRRTEPSGDGLPKIEHEPDGR
jgi:membrane protein YdbS with pleckstrin-like domain